MMRWSELMGLEKRKEEAMAPLYGRRSGGYAGLEYGYDDAILKAISSVRGRLTVADSAANLRAYRERGSEHWADLTAELLTELAISHAALARAIDAVGEQCAGRDGGDHSADEPVAPPTPIYTKYGECDLGTWAAWSGGPR